VELRVITWNLFHGRDAPPDPGLFTWRSRLFGVTEQNPTHVQVNRDLLAEFTRLLAGASWDVAMLQECPPRWLPLLANACGANWHRSLTSRNRLGTVRALLARANPDLLGSNEGGSNTTLVRSATRVAPAITNRRELVICDRRPERRTMAFTDLRCGVSVANLHATNDRPFQAEAELRLAAETAVGWARDRPLILGGDLNVRPDESSIYEELHDRFGFSLPAARGSIDHLLLRNGEVLDGPRAWPARERELPAGARALRLSDHTPVEAVFGMNDASAG
jgi:endonuclease/exonuclease/phosphatase family metal-dependent hydrolase